MTAKIEVTASRRVGAPPRKVHDAWLDPTQVRRWLSAALKDMGLSGDIADVRVVPEVGGAFLWSDMRDGVEARHWGTYLELDPPHTIVSTWNTAESDEFDPSIVRLTIRPDGDGSAVTITNQLDAKWAADRAAAEKGWSTMLKALDELLRR